MEDETDLKPKFIGDIIVVDYSQTHIFKGIEMRFIIFCRVVIFDMIRHRCIGNSVSVVKLYLKKSIVMFIIIIDDRHAHIKLMLLKRIACFHSRPEF